MNSLVLAVTLLGLALATTWILGAVVLGGWRLAWALGVDRARLGRLVPCLMLLPPALAAALTYAVAFPDSHHCHCVQDVAVAVHLCVSHPQHSLALLPLGLALLGLFGLRVVPHLRRLAPRIRTSLALAPGSGVFARVSEPFGNALSLAFPRPRIVVDGAWWAELAPAERRIVLAHEGAHLRRGDPLLLEVMSLVGHFQPAWLAVDALAAWRAHAECQADAAAARTVGDAPAVATLLVDLHRRAIPQGAPGLAMSDGAGLEERVRALLDESTVIRPGPDLGRTSWLLLGVVMAVPLLSAHRVHVAFESLLGLFT
ncbi:MAG: hypothetical protein AAF533_20260 [Acidobacteriota bacterium]